MTAPYSGQDNLEVMKLAVNYNEHLIRMVVEHANGSRVVDFGAGIGTFAIALRQRGLEVTCIEPDAVLAKEIERAALDVHGSLETIPADSLPFIFSFNVLEHIADDAAALSEIYSRLQPGGKLLLYLPACPVLFSAMDRKVGHYRRYRRAELRQSLVNSGFNVADIRYADSMGFFATLAYKWFGNTIGDVNPGGLALYDRYVFPLSATIDRLFGGAFGKNVVAIAQKPRHL